MQKQVKNIGNYFSLVKIHHTLFSLPFAMIGLFLAFKETGEGISIKTALLVILCVLFARNAAMAFNRYADLEYDRKNPRTAGRELPRNIISKPSALAFIIINAAFFMGAAFLLNNLCFLLSPLALLIVMGYSYTKRFTSLSHVFLGLGLGLAPIGAYIAVTAHFAILPLLFSFSVIFWVSGFDIIYAMSGGGPGYASETLNIMAFKYSFEYFKMGQAAVILVVLFMIVLGLSVGILKLRTWTEQ